jgi:hypothetical protein
LSNSDETKCTTKPFPLIFGGVNTNFIVRTFDVCKADMNIVVGGGFYNSVVATYYDAFIMRLS